jgi:hypothetical protein
MFLDLKRIVKEMYYLQAMKIFVSYAFTIYSFVFSLFEQCKKSCFKLIIEAIRFKTGFIH